jgi:hypothetical protein
VGNLGRAFRWCRARASQQAAGGAPQNCCRFGATLVLIITSFLFDRAAIDDETLEIGVTAVDRLRVTLAIGDAVIGLRNEELVP